MTSRTPRLLACVIGCSVALQLLAAEPVLPQRAELPAEPADLWQAINAHSLPLVQRIATDPNAVDPLGQPALLLAATRGDADIARWLLERGAKVDIRGPRDWTPLIAATFGGHADVVELLLEHRASTAAVSADGLAPLFYAIDYGYIDILDRLIAAGADANAATAVQFQDGHSVLMRAAMRNVAEAAVHLLAAGARLEQRDARGRTALFYAARYDATDVLDVLVRTPVDRAARDADGNTALQAMAEKGQVATAQRLLDMHVDANARNRAGDTALIIAARAGNTEVTRLLAERAGSAARIDALSAAAQGGSSKTVVALLDIGLPVDARPGGGATPLMIAARHGHAHLVDELLRRGADAKARDAAGDDALLLALASPPVHVGMVRQLLEAGADTTKRNRKGRNALQLIAASDDAELRAVLEQPAR